jgi:hypothetical protein
MITERQKAEQQGWAVDTTVYPWLAYKGPRFNPTQTQQIETDKESALRSALSATRNRLQLTLEAVQRALKL